MVFCRVRLIFVHQHVVEIKLVLIFGKLTEPLRLIDIG